MKAADKPINARRRLKSDPVDTLDSEFQKAYMNPNLGIDHLDCE
jgi:hypothetical protein